MKIYRLCNTPVTLYRDYTELARRCGISQSAVGSPKNAENRCILFSIFTPWRSHVVPTAIVVFLRRFHRVLSRSCGVLVGDRLRAHSVLMACPRRAHRVLGAVTARARRAHGARTESTPFMTFRISIRIMLCLPAIVDVMSQSPALISCCPARELNRLRSWNTTSGTPAVSLPQCCLDWNPYYCPHHTWKKLNGLHTGAHT